jgi:hypothetical protein
MPRQPNRRTDHGPLLPLPQAWGALIGRKFGHLTVIGYTGVMTKHKQRKITCRCDCSAGYYVDVLRHALESSNTTSCGCVQSESVRASNRARSGHPPLTGRTTNPLYQVWASIKRRCFNPECAAYKDYGGRGITMYGPWAESFEVFQAYVEGVLGPRPSPDHSLDRPNNDGNYQPGNFRWATKKQQARNTRRSKIHEINGEHKPMMEWIEIARHHGSAICANTVKNRIYHLAWTLDDALATPAGFGGPITDRVPWTKTESYQSYLKSKETQP